MRFLSTCDKVWRPKELSILMCSTHIISYRNKYHSSKDNTHLTCHRSFFTSAIFARTRIECQCEGGGESGKWNEGKSKKKKKKTYQHVWHVSIRRDPARERRVDRAYILDQLLDIPPGRVVRMVFRRFRCPRRHHPPHRQHHRLRRFRCYHFRDWPSPPRGRSPRRSVHVPYGAVTNHDFYN